jgi:hypothetical protein
VRHLEVERRRERVLRVEGLFGEEEVEKVTR